MMCCGDRNWIEVLSYSPNGRWLAVGTHGFIIAILDVAKGYAFYASLKAHNAAITHLDWSADSKYIQVCVVIHCWLFGVGCVPN